MRIDSRSYLSATLFTLLGSATIGAITVALTTPRTGREVRNSVRKLGSRLRGQAVASDQEEEEVAFAAFI